MSSGWLDTVRVVRVGVVMFCVFLMHFVRHPFGMRHCVKINFNCSQVMHLPLSTALAIEETLLLSGKYEAYCIVRYQRCASEFSSTH